MKAHEVFPGRFLTAADLAGGRPVVTIERVFTEEIGGEHKRCVAFVGKQKILKLNKTNWGVLAEITGRDDDEHWVGVRLRLVVAKVPFQGKSVDAIRIEAVDPPAPAAAMPKAGDIQF